jgi:hypothetical protein
MSLELLIVGGGIILLVAAALGGGFEAREIKIPPLEGGSRAICAVVGIGMVAFGMSLRENPQSTENPSSPTFTAVNFQQPMKEVSTVPQSVTARLIDRLYSDQVEENVDVYIGGKLVASLRVDRNKPVTTAEVLFPSEGAYPYRIVGTERYQRSNGVNIRPFSGEGMISVKEGSALALYGGYDPDREPNPVSNFFLAPDKG